MAIGYTAAEFDPARDGCLVGVVSITDPGAVVFFETPTPANVPNSDFYIYVDARVFRVSGERRHRVSPARTTFGFLFHLCRRGLCLTKREERRESSPSA